MKFSPEYYVNIFQHTVTIPIVPIQEDDEKLCIDLTFSEWELSDYYKNSSWKCAWEKFLSMVIPGHEFYSGYFGIKFTVYQEVIDDKGFKQHKLKFESNKVFGKDDYSKLSNVTSVIFGKLFTCASMLNAQSDNSAISKWGISFDTKRPLDLNIHKKHEFNYVMAVYSDPEEECVNWVISRASKNIYFAIKFRDVHNFQNVISQIQCACTNFFKSYGIKIEYEE